jgi:hypothetical protein
MSRSAWESLLESLEARPLAIDTHDDDYREHTKPAVLAAAVESVLDSDLEVLDDVVRQGCKWLSGAVRCMQTHRLSRNDAIGWGQLAKVLGHACSAEAARGLWETLTRATATLLAELSASRESLATIARSEGLVRVERAQEQLARFCRSPLVAAALELVVMLSDDSWEWVPDKLELNTIVCLTTGVAMHCAEASQWMAAWVALTRFVDGGDTDLHRLRRRSSQQQQVLQMIFSHCLLLLHAHCVMHGWEAHRRQWASERGLDSPPDMALGRPAESGPCKIQGALWLQAWARWLGSGASSSESVLAMSMVETLVALVPVRKDLSSKTKERTAWLNEQAVWAIHCVEWFQHMVGNSRPVTRGDTWLPRPGKAHRRDASEWATLPGFPSLANTEQVGQSLLQTMHDHVRRHATRGGAPLRKALYRLLACTLPTDSWVMHAERCIVGTESGVDCRCALLCDLADLAEEGLGEGAQGCIVRLLCTCMTLDASWRVRVRSIQTVSAWLPFLGVPHHRATIGSSLLTRLFDTEQVALEASSLLLSGFGGICGIGEAVLSSISSDSLDRVDECLGGLSADSRARQMPSQCVGALVLVCLDAFSSRKPWEGQTIENIRLLGEFASSSVLVST